MKPIKTKAPGKLLLLGDHAVIYNRPCLVAAIDKWVRVTVTENKTKESIFVAAARQLFEQKYGQVKAGFEITGFDSRYGLGSSAAVTVATAKAMFAFKKIDVTNKTLFDFCYQVVKKVQGVGSGFDIAAAIYGGVIYFVTGGKKIKRLTVEELPIVVGYSGAKANTAMMIKKTSSIINEKFLQQSADIVEHGRIILEQKNWPALGKLMNQNQEILSKIGASTPKLDQLIATCLQAGAYGAKLSGAGGGDCMIALVSGQKKAVVAKAIESAGGTVIKIKLAL